MNVNVVFFECCPKKIVIKTGHAEKTDLDIKFLKIVDTTLKYNPNTFIWVKTYVLELLVYTPWHLLL